MSSSDQKLDKNEVSEAIHNYLEKSKTISSLNVTKKLEKDITLIEDPNQVLANDITEVKSLFSQVRISLVICISFLYFFLGCSFYLGTKQRQIT